MSTEPASTAPPGDDSDVRVPDAVLRKMRGLKPRVASVVAHAILGIPSRDAEPIRLDVPGDPPGTTYWGLLPRIEEAPAVIYRESLHGEEGKWRVTALMDRDAYRAYSRGLSNDVVVRGVAAVVATGTITASDLASAEEDQRISGRDSTDAQDPSARRDR